MMGNWGMWFGTWYAIVCLIAGSFIFSVIFWATYKWMVQKERKKIKNKRR